MSALWYNKKLVKEVRKQSEVPGASTPKEEWEQAHLQVGHSPLNVYFGAKRWFEKWDSRFKYNEFFLSWQVWWLFGWSGTYAILMYFWLSRVWGSLPSSLPMLYISHSLESIMLSRYWLIGLLSIPILFAVAILFLVRAFVKPQKELAFVWVLFQLILSVACFVTAFKIVTIFG